jgi:hypothetical protein
MKTNDEYVKRLIEGKYDLNTINIMIVGQEAKGFEFKDNEVVEYLTNSAEKINIVTFRKLTYERPKELILVYSGNPQPDGTEKVWSGKMIVEGKETEVTAYRKV